MLFNHDPNKRDLEIHFSEKRDKDSYTPLNFNVDNAETAVSQKHLGLVLDSKLDFNEYTNNKISKCNKIIVIMKNLLYFCCRKLY